MTELPKLALFFASKTAFKQHALPQAVLIQLSLYLRIDGVFKRSRIAYLLVNQTHVEENWFELYNWYYREFQNTIKPAWYKEKLHAFSSSSNNIRLMSYHAFLQAHWSVEDVVKSSIFLSEDGINNYHANSQETLHWTRLRQKNLSLFTGAVCAGELIGQAGFIMLDKLEYQQLQEGELAESDIQGTTLDTNGPVYLYIPSVVIKLEFQNRYLLPEMLRHLFLQLAAEPKLLNRLEGFIALAYSDAGERMCKGFNLQLINAKIRSIWVPSPLF
jgi:hypothetical protein